MNLGGLGYFAGGAAQGLERGQLMSVQNQRMGLLDAAEQRLRKQDSRMDKQAADLEAARMEAADVINQDRSNYETKAASLPGPTMDGGPVPSNPYQPDEKVRVKALETYAEGLMRRGYLDDGAKAWTVAESQRVKMRAAPAQQVLATLSVGGDITGPLSEFYQLVPNGHTLVSAKPVKMPDGQMGYTLELQNDKTGERLPAQTVPAAKIADDISRAMASPQDLAKYGLQTAMERAKADFDIQVNREKEKDKRTTGAEEAAAKAERDAAQHKLTMTEIGARGAQDRLTDSSKPTNTAGADTKVLAEARRAVDTAQRQVAGAEARAMKIRLDGMDAIDLTASQRAKAIDDDPAVRAARKEYADALAVLKRVQSGASLQDASGPPPDTAKKRIKMDANGNVIP